MSREALRLLAALAAPGAYAIPDPIEDGTLILRSGGAGVSVGGGRFPAPAGDSLVAADLAAREPGPRGRLSLGPAGQARLRRAAAVRELGPEAAFLGQHLDLVPDAEAPGAPGGAQASAQARLRDAAESPLAWMARRRGRDGAPLLDAASYEAGERLRRDMTGAMMLPRMGTDWGAPRVDGSGPRDPASASDAILAARQRVRGALDAVGSDLSGLLLDLCGHLKGLERIELERRWPARSAKVVARIALGRLAEHYGLEREAVGPARARTRLWRARA
ncbi:ATPase [Methylobacterium planeticum]|uniref:ATPase n=1 Tax=Methylobacterium planeticum TaxID=2615211 RepID=A0A6N6MNA1_9HYPH|nr:ATPase [Methylobacterium planeticum]